MSFLEANAYLYLAVFCRIGSTLMVLPGFGEIDVPTQIRLALALLMSFVMMPVVAGYYPAMPGELGPLAGIMLGEIAYGLALGMLVRIFLSALQVGGTIIAAQTGLSFAQNFDPTLGIQGALLSSFMTIFGITLIFVTDLDHVMIVGLKNAYDILVPGQVPQWGDFADLAMRTTSRMFGLGVEMAAPFILFSLVFYAAAGAISRLLPQLQIFFIVVPLNILAGFALFMVAIGSIMMLFLNGLGEMLMHDWP